MYKEALKIAYKAHEGQFRRESCVPYITHPLRVASWFANDTFFGEIKKTIAVLHDTIEDTELELKDLKGFPKKIIKAIDALSRRQGEQYFDYINRLKKNELAVEIKIADIVDNLSDTLSIQSQSMIKRYNKSLKILLT